MAEWIPPSFFDGSERALYVMAAKQPEEIDDESDTGDAL